MKLTLLILQALFPHLGEDPAKPVVQEPVFSSPLPPAFTGL